MAAYLELDPNIAKLEHRIPAQRKVQVLHVERLGVEELQPRQGIPEQPLGHRGALERLEEHGHGAGGVEGLRAEGEAVAMAALAAEGEDEGDGR